MSKKTYYLLNIRWQVVGCCPQRYASDFVTLRVVSCVAFALHDFTTVYQTAAYAELERTDRAAQKVTAKDTKLR